MQELIKDRYIEVYDARLLFITEWIKFCLDIFRYENMTVTFKTNKNASATTKY